MSMLEIALVGQQSLFDITYLDISVGNRIQWLPYLLILCTSITRVEQVYRSRKIVGRNTQRCEEKVATR
jgi:hypothetical protein